MRLSILTVQAALTLPEHGMQHVAQKILCPYSLNLTFAGDGSNEGSAKTVYIFNFRTPVIRRMLYLHNKLCVCV